MTPKTFIWVAVSTAVALAAVAVSLGRDTGYQPAAGAGEKVFPGLLKRVNDIASISIEHAGGTVTLENGAKGWTMKDRQGYPARAVKIKRSVLGLAQLQLHEAKTRRKEKYAKLELRDIGAPVTNKGTDKGVKSKRVKLFDAAGTVVADLIVGKRRDTLAGTTGGGLYVRKPGDQQTWLAAGDANFSGTLENWLERKIVDIKGARVQTVVIRHPDGETVKVSKAAEKTKDFTLDTLPEGKKVIIQFDLNAIGKALADLQLDDVKKDTGGFDGDTATATEVLTFDGLFVQVRIIKRDGANWIRLEATGDKANGITARTKGWVYKISDYAASTLTKRTKDLVEDVKSGS